jgi:hypothetical protein
VRARHRTRWEPAAALPRGPRLPHAHAPAHARARPPCLWRAHVPARARAHARGHAHRQSCRARRRTCHGAAPPRAPGNQCFGCLRGRRLDDQRARAGKRSQVWTACALALPREARARTWSRARSKARARSAGQTLCTARRWPLTHAQQQALVVQELHEHVRRGGRKVAGEQLLGRRRQKFGVCCWLPGIDKAGGGGLRGFGARAHAKPQGSTGRTRTHARPHHRRARPTRNKHATEVAPHPPCALAFASRWKGLGSRLK